jgi:hypothetical protein
MISRREENGWGAKPMEDVKEIKKKDSGKGCFFSPPPGLPSPVRDKIIDIKKHDPPRHSELHALFFQHAYGYRCGQPPICASCHNIYFLR